jgi:pimeloyl-ACP methyl ester carboxylesterase
MICALVVACLATVASTADAQMATGRFVDRVYRDQLGEHKYVVFEPAGYTPARKWPTILYLHGASGRGKDGRSQLVVGMGPAVKHRAATLPFLVVFPQCENLNTRLLGGWHEEPTELDRALKVLQAVEQDYAVDRQHEVLVGTSMGGFGVWSLAARDPKRWRAIAPISGGGTDEMVPALAKVPVWTFHAEDDVLVPPTVSTGLVDGIRRAGGRAWVSLLPSGGHNISRAVLSRDEVFEWLLHPEKTPNTAIDWTEPRELPNLTHEMPFVPGADVSRAVQVHLGRDLLDSWAALMPELVPADALSGWKAGTTESTQAGPFTFNVSISGVHYSGTLERAWMEPLPGNQLRLQLGLRNLQMTIPSTHIRGFMMRANAGPMTVYIGYHSPVWLTADVAPVVENRRLRMNLIGVDFRIPPDNWSISRPNVQVRGLRFMRDRISNELVEGVAGKQYMIEAEIRNAVPTMLAQMERQLAEYQERVVAFHNWPMPLWMPRFKFYPESIAITDRGVDIQLGAIVAALGQRPAAGSPLLRVPSDSTIRKVSQPAGMEFAVSSRLISAWSELMVTGDIARFHVFDLSSPRIQELGGRDFWETVLPSVRSLPADTAVETTFALAQPLKLHGYESGTVPPSPSGHVKSDLTVEVPQMQLRLAVREPGQSKFRTYAEFDLVIRQSYHLEIKAPSFVRRELHHWLIPADAPSVKIRALPNGTAPADVDVERLAAQFGRGWVESFNPEHRSVPLQDTAFAKLPLRWSQIGWDGAQLVARWDRPGIRIINATQSPAVYDVRGMTTTWTTALRLPPGGSHEFRPLTAMAWKPAGTPGEGQYRIGLGEEIEIRPQGLVSLVPKANLQQTAER